MIFLRRKSDLDYLRKANFRPLLTSLEIKMIKGTEEKYYVCEDTEDLLSPALTQEIPYTGIQFASYTVLSEFWKRHSNSGMSDYY